MYLETNKLFNQCADTMQGQFALNMRFLDSAFQSQKRWVERAINHQQQLQNAVSKSDDLVQMGESAQACIEEVVENWLADCEEICQTLHQHSQEVSGFYRSSADSLEGVVCEQSLSSKKPSDSMVETKSAGEASTVKAVNKTRSSSARKTAVKKPVAKALNSTVSAQTDQKSMTPASRAKKSVKPATPKTKAVSSRVTPIEKQEVAKKVAVKTPVKKKAASKVIANTAQPAAIEKQPTSTVSKIKEITTNELNNSSKK